MSHLRIHTDRLRKGMVIANNVHSRSGAILIPEGTAVTKDVMTLLARHFIEYVIVDYQTDGFPAPVASPVPGDAPKINEQKFAEFKERFQIAEDTLSENLREIAEKNNDVDVLVLLSMLNQIVEKSENDMNLCDMLFHMKKNAENLYTHSINVALLAQILAKWMDFHPSDLEPIAISALLHDIGILKLPENEMKDFTFKQELERGKYDKHTILGYNLIKDKAIDIRIKQAVLTHHERLDQSGFPLQVPSKNINPISRIIAIADVYDTLIMKEDGAKTLSPFLVLKELEKDGYHKFDSQMLMTFLSKVTYNFIQHTVLLSNGERAQIVLINKYNLSRPLVQIGSTFVDLAVRTDLHIKELLD